MLALGGAGVSEANGVPPVAGLLDGTLRPFGSATGPSTPLRDRINSAQGPERTLRDRGWCSGAGDGAQGPGNQF